LQTLVSPKELHTTAVALSVQPLDEKNSISLPEVVVVDNIPVKPNVNHNATFLKQRYLSRKVFLPTLKNGTVELLIGANVPKVFRVEIVKPGYGKGPDAVCTPLGWSLLGPAFANVQFVHSKPKHQVEFDRAHALFLRDESDLNPIPAQSESDDNLAVVTTKISAEGSRTYKLMIESVQIVDGHYELPLPWRNDFQILPDNSSVVMKHLRGLERRLSRDEELKKKYINQMHATIEKGYAEEVPKSEINTERHVWFIPHRPVMSPKKPDKVRIRL